MKNLNWFVLLLIPFISSCQKQDGARQYTEVVSQVQERAVNPVSDMTDSRGGQEMPMGTEDPHAFMKTIGSGDPHAGYTKEQLQAMLQQEGVIPPAITKNSPLTWTVPNGWKENPGNGMRLATFVNQSAPQAIDCSIVTLGAAAGGLAPNVIRWMQQISIDLPAEDQLNQFIEKQERLKIDNTLTAIIFDFTALQKNAAPSASSMIAAIIDTPSQRIFVKMTGTRQKILENIKPFKSLVQSIKSNS